MLNSSKKIAELEAKIAEQNTATEELTAAHAAAIAEKDTKISELETQLTEQREVSVSRAAELDTAVKANAAAASEISDLKSQLEAAKKDVEQKIADGVIKGLAEAGVEPIKRDPKAPEGDAKEPISGAVTGFARVLAATKAAFANK